MATKRKYNGVTLKKQYEALKSLTKIDQKRSCYSVQRFWKYTCSLPSFSKFTKETTKRQRGKYQHNIVKDQSFLAEVVYLDAWQQHSYQWPDTFRKSSPSSHIGSPSSHIHIINCTFLKKWSWRNNRNFEQIKSVYRGFRFSSFNLKLWPTLSVREKDIKSGNRR